MKSPLTERGASTPQIEWQAGAGFGMHLAIYEQRLDEGETQ